MVVDVLRELVYRIARASMALVTKSRFGFQGHQQRVENAGIVSSLGSGREEREAVASALGALPDPDTSQREKVAEELLR